MLKSHQEVDDSNKDEGVDDQTLGCGTTIGKGNLQTDLGGELVHHLVGPGGGDDQEDQTCYERNR